MKERQRESCSANGSLFRSFTLSLVKPLFRSLSCIFALSLVHSFALCQSPGFSTVHDFTDDWQVFDPAAKTYVPYLPELHAKEPAVSAFVDLESNRSYTLLIQSDRDGYLFFDAALRRKLPAGVWQVLSIDSLFRHYRQPQLFVTLYGAAGTAGKHLLIGHKKSVGQPVAQLLPEDNLSVRPVPRSAYTDFLGLGLLFLLANGALLIAANQRAFKRFFDWRDMITLRVRDEAFLINKPFSGISLLFVLHLSFLLAYLLLFAQSQGLDLYGVRTVLPVDPDLTALLLGFVGLSLTIFLLYIGKYFALFAMGQLYRADNVANIHFFKLIQSSLLFFTGLVLLSAILAGNLSSTDWLSVSILIPIGLFYVARLGLLYLTIAGLGSLKNLYLISYLCLVELIPLIIGLRFAH